MAALEITWKVWPNLFNYTSSYKRERYTNMPIPELRVYKRCNAFLKRNIYSVQVINRPLGYHNISIDATVELTHCGLVTLSLTHCGQVASYNLFNNGSYNGLLPDSTKHETNVTNH